MFVRRPGRPVSRLAERDAGENAAGLDVLADQDVQVAPGRGSTGVEVERRVFLNVSEPYELNRILPFDRRCDFGEVAPALFRIDGDGRVAGNVQRVVSI